MEKVHKYVTDEGKAFEKGFEYNSNRMHQRKAIKN